MRARIDVSEIEAKTKIRAKYLRALENEEWGLLPGPTFVKSFLRTYAQALDLDGKALVEEYRLHHERPSETLAEPIVSTPQSRQRSKGSQRGRAGSAVGPSRAYVLTVGAIGAVIVVLIALLIAGGGSSGNPSSTSASRTTSGRSATAKQHATPASRRSVTSAPQLVTLSLKPTALVYVCLLGDNGRKLIPGVNLQPGEATPTYHARRFEITLGNSSVTMLVDGIPRKVSPSSQAIGYSITKASGRHLLPAGQLPTCV